MAVYLSGTTLKTLGELAPFERERIFGVLERVRIRPEKYVRKLLNDPAYRLRMEGFNLYIDLSEGDLVVLLIMRN